MQRRPLEGVYRTISRFLQKFFLQNNRFLQKFLSYDFFGANVATIKEKKAHTPSIWYNCITAHEPQIVSVSSQKPAK